MKFYVTSGKFRSQCWFMLVSAAFGGLFLLLPAANSLLRAVLGSAVRDGKPPDTSPLHFAAEPMPVQAVPAPFQMKQLHPLLPAPELAAAREFASTRSVHTVHPEQGFAMFHSDSDTALHRQGSAVLSSRHCTTRLQLLPDRREPPAWKCRSKAIAERMSLPLPLQRQFVSPYKNPAQLQRQCRPNLLL